MSSNPLFPDNPLRPAPADQAAIELIRKKVARAYGEEPEADTALKKTAHPRTPSKHQQFLQQLAASGKSIADVQTEWHHYYTSLPDAEKHDVWQEFYAANQYTPYQKLFQKQQPIATRTRLDPAPTPPAPKPQVLTQPSRVTTTASGVVIADHTPESPPQPDPPKPRRRKKNKIRAKTNTLILKTKVGRQVANSDAAQATRRLKQNIQQKVSAGGKLETKHHVQSLLFGLGMGAVVLSVLLFGFFNEYVIAPFIQPSRTVTNTPIIVSNMTATQAAQPTVIVPFINIQIPVDFSVASNEEATIQNSLENGVVHYPSTVLPGQNGNGAYFGHSSQNIFNNGKYKYAFVALHLVKTGDIFYITYQGKVYAYQIFAKEVVPPTQVSVLSDTKGEQATAVLITCDPPGFSTNRLVVWGKQISPSPATNTVAAQPAVAPPPAITSKGPSLWSRVWRGVQFWR